MQENTEDAKDEASLLFRHAFVFPCLAVDCSSGHFGSLVSCLEEKRLVKIVGLKISNSSLFL